jgi:hypothetical protein
MTLDMMDPPWNWLVYKKRKDGIRLSLPLKRPTSPGGVISKGWTSAGHRSPIGEAGFSARFSER